MTRLKTPKLWTGIWEEEEADSRGISPQLPGPESRGLDRARRSLMLEGAPRGAESCGGVRQKQPQTSDTSAATVGVRRRPPHARLALGCALFSALPRTNLRCEWRWAAGRGQRAAGRTDLPCPASLGAERRKTTAPSGSASPLPALPGAPLPSKRQCYWCYWCDWCPLGSSWPGNALPGSPRPHQTVFHLLCLGPGTGAGPQPVMGWLSVSQHLPKSHSTKSAPWSVPRLPPAPHTAGHPSCSPPGQGHSWAWAVVL